MSNQLKCEIVCDLLPSYLDGLTSDVTNKEIEQHLYSCSACSSKLEKMRIPVETPMDSREMDYLKKIRNHSKTILVMGIGLTIAFVWILIWVRCYAVGFQVQNVADYKVLYSPVQPEEGIYCLVIQGELESRSMVYTQYHVTTKGDAAVISLSERLAWPWENNNAFYVGYEIPDHINTVTLGDNILWEKGTVISEEVNTLYRTKHAYIGDMPANGAVSDALHIVEKFGNFKNSLQTTAEPYGWTLEFEDGIAREEIFNARMTQYAYVMLSMIDNLGEVSWKYNNGKEYITKTVTIADASKATGQEIKSYSKSISQLQELVDFLYLY